MNKIPIHPAFFLVIRAACRTWTGWIALTYVHLLTGEWIPAVIAGAVTLTLGLRAAGFSKTETKGLRWAMRLATRAAITVLLDLISAAWAASPVRQMIALKLDIHVSNFEACLLLLTVLLVFEFAAELTPESEEVEPAVDRRVPTSSNVEFGVPERSIATILIETSAPVVIGWLYCDRTCVLGWGQIGGRMEEMMILKKGRYEIGLRGQWSLLHKTARVRVWLTPYPPPKNPELNCDPGAVEGELKDKLLALAEHRTETLLQPSEPRRFHRDT